MLCLVNIAVWSRDVEHWQNVTGAPESIRNVDPEAHAANKLDKTHHERGSDSYRRYQKVAVRNGKEEKAVIFWTCHAT